MVSAGQSAIVLCVSMCVGRVVSARDAGTVLVYSSVLSSSIVAIAVRADVASAWFLFAVRFTTGVRTSVPTNGAPVAVLLESTVGVTTVLMEDSSVAFSSNDAGGGIQEHSITEAKNTTT